MTDRRRFWLVGEVAALRDLAARGFTGPQAAAAIGRTPSAVRAKALTIGLVFARPWCWTPAQIATLRRLAAQGCTPRQVAEQIGRTVSAVHQEAFELDVSFARPHNVELLVDPQT